MTYLRDRNTIHEIIPQAFRRGFIAKTRPTPVPSLSHICLRYPHFDPATTKNTNPPITALYRPLSRPPAETEPSPQGVDCYPNFLETVLFKSSFRIATPVAGLSYICLRYPLLVPPLQKTPTLGRANI